MQETTNLIGNQKLFNALKNIKNFQTFSDEDLRSFLDLGKLRRYETGEIIIMEDDSDKLVYFLLSGEVKVMKEGRTFKLMREGGSLFGEMGMLDGLPRSASIQANSPTLVLCLDGALIGHSAQSKRVSFYFTVFKFFAKVLTRRLRNVTLENAQLRDELFRKENLLRQHTRGNDLVM